MQKYKTPTFVRLPKNKLKVNTDFYQKMYVPANVQKFVKTWDDNAVGTLTVVHDKNDDYWVVDGQHRLLAAKKLPHVKTLPCMVHDSDDVNNDARLYVKINTTHKKPDVKHLFKISYELGDEPAKTLGDILTECGFNWRNHNQKTCVKPVCSCISIVKAAYADYGEDITKEALGILGYIHTNEATPTSLNGDVLLGLCFLLDHYEIPDQDKFTNGIHECTPTFLKACCSNAVISSPLNHHAHAGRSVLAQGVATAVNSKMGGRYKKAWVYLKSSED